VISTPGGHIRAIARTVEADPGPLIAEYDATQRTPGPVTAVDLFRPVTPVRLRERRRVNWAAALGLALVAAVGFGAYQVISSTRHPPAAVPAARTGPAIHRHTGRATPRPSPAATPVSGPYAHKVAVRLVAIEDCWVEFTTPGGGYLFQSYVAGGTSKAWSFRHAVAMRLGNPGGITLTVDGKNPLPPGTSHPITLSLGLNGKISS